MFVVWISVFVSQAFTNSKHVMFYDGNMQYIVAHACIYCHISAYLSVIFILNLYDAAAYRYNQSINHVLCCLFRCILPILVATRIPLVLMHSPFVPV